MTSDDGTLTFLFTDIEGSTALWEERPEEMRAALARHDAVMRAAINGAGGTVFKTIGDAFCAVFQRADAAAKAAEGAQRALAPLEGDLPLRVRMAIHSGPVEARDNDYFGPALNRVARLLATAHGGQVVLSQAARHEVGTGFDAHDLGEHRLKDLQQPERVYQLLILGLRDDFPPLRSLSATTTNLPIQTTSFTGREKELAELKALFPTTKLLTLTGSGGIGKTRMALQLAADLIEADGAWLIELGPVSDPGLLFRVAATALEVAEEPGRRIQDTLFGFLKGKKLLLILDNCEHLLDACAEFVGGVLRTCPGVRIIATSREALAVSGELTYRVPSLSLPVEGEEPGASESVRLFFDRARFHNQSFSLTPDNAESVASIVRRLDGIPLAIELAAARLRALSLSDLQARLDDRFRILTGGSRTALPRQQTLRALIDWSYDLLLENEKLFLARLSVFSAGWTLEEAERVCSDERISDLDVLNLLSSLVDKSLVNPECERYEFLETVRQYARDRLHETGETEAMRDRHLDYFRGLAEEAEPHLRSADAGVWLDRLASEHDNVRAALEWAQSKLGGSEPGLRLATALLRYWAIRGHRAEGLAGLRALLGSESDDTSLQPAALTASAFLSYETGDFVESRDFHLQALALRRNVLDPIGIANSLNGIGLVYAEMGEFLEAEDSFRQSREFAEKGGDAKTASAALVNLGLVKFYKAEYAEAETLFRQGLATVLEAGNARAEANILNHLGYAAIELGRFEEGRDLLERSGAKAHELADGLAIGNNLIGFAMLTAYQGDRHRAIELYREGLAAFREAGDRNAIGITLTRLAPLLIEEGHLEEARSCILETAEMCEACQTRRLAVGLFSAAALLAHRTGMMAEAGRLMAISESLRVSLGSSVPPLQREGHDALVSAIGARFEAAEDWRDALPLALSVAQASAASV